MKWPRLSATILGTQATALGVMLAGVVLVCLTWILLGLDVARQLAIVEAQSRESQRRAALSASLSSVVRVQILLGSVAFRDLLLERDPDAREAVRAQIVEAETAAVDALSEYARLAETTNQTTMLEQIRREARDYWLTIARAASPDAQALQSDQLRRVQQDVILRRRGLLRLIDQAETEVQDATLRSQTDLAVIHASARQHLWWGGALALVLSTGITVVGARRIRALEQALARQRLEGERKTTDLQRLSVRLMTVQDDERRSIARELHDEVGQALTALKLELGLIQQQLDAGAPAEQALDGARQMADDTLEDLRSLSRLLHPAVLDDLGLASSLELYLRTFGARTGISTRFDCSVPDLRFPPEVETCVYRSVQEALTNIVRHANASTCVVTLTREDGVLLVCVEDDGEGFEVDARGARPAGLGLVGLGERATTLGGSVRVDSRVGGGTRLTVRVPAPIVMRQADAADLPEPARHPSA